MKVWKILLIVAAALIAVLILAAVIFVYTFDINRYKPQIIRRASEALGRPVDFTRASLVISLSQGISLKITGLSVGEDPAFGQGDFLTVKNASFGVDVLGYIFQKKISVPSIFIDSPRITFIRSGDGSVNIEKIGKLKEKERGISIPSLAALPALFISSVKSTDGALVYIDRMFKPALTLEIKDLFLEATSVSLADSFPFTLEATVFSNQRNVFIEGNAQFDLRENSVTISGLKGTTDLSRVSWGDIPANLAMTKNMILPTSAKGQLVLLIREAILGAKGLSALSAEVSLQKGSLRLKEMAQALEDVALNVKITEKDLLFEKASARLGTGKLEFSAAVQDYFLKQIYKMQVSAEDVSLADLIAQDKSPVKVAGTASSQFALNGEGFSPSNINSNLSGQAEIRVLKPMLKDINVLRTVLDKISVIPGLSEKIEAGLPERFKKKMAQKNTVFSDIKLPLTIANGRLMMKDAILEADEFIFKGQGEAGFDGTITLEGAFLIPQDLSQAMVAAQDKLQYLLNADSQIYIPLKVSGNAAGLKFNVDPAYIAQKLLTEQGKEQIFKLIDKALGTKKDSGQPQEQNAQGEEGVQDREPTAKEKVSDILQDILGK